MTIFSTIHAAWSTVEFVALWSGLSIGTIVGLAALFYFVPLARKLAVQCAIVVVIAWACLMHGHIAGRADEESALKILSANDDKNAALQAAADDKARADTIEQKAKEQHETDLAEIARLEASGNDCSFDPDAGGVQPSGGNASSTPVVGDKAKPAASTKAARKGSTAAAARQKLHLPVVWPSWLQGKGHNGDASPHGQ